MYYAIFDYSLQSLFIGSYYHGRTTFFKCVNLLHNYHQGCPLVTNMLPYSCIQVFYTIILFYFILNFIFAFKDLKIKETEDGVCVREMSEIAKFKVKRGVYKKLLLNIRWT